MTDLSGADRVLAYHERTKHYPMRFARSLGYLDWDNQPDPFRRFEGTRLVPLLHDPSEAGPSLGALADPRAPYAAPAPLALASVSRLLELALGLTAWKQYGSSRWALRANPSSGNLHPTEGYVVLPAAAGLGASPGVYHYASREHALEQRCVFGADVWKELAEGLPDGSFLAGLTSIHWREAWKYGERAFRYCQHDVGHAVGALRYAAAALGWSLRVLAFPGDADVASVLGVDRAGDFEGAEAEHPDLLAWIVPGAAPAPGLAARPWPPAGALARLRSSAWCGRANRLSTEHVEWDVIDGVALHGAKTAGAPGLPAGIETFPPGPSAAADATLPAARIVRQRRSAVAFDGATGMPRERFFDLLDRTLPRAACAPFDAFEHAPAVHIALFVHRVEGLEPGIYFLLRRAGAAEALRAAMRPAFPWSRVASAPAHLPLHLLKPGDHRAWGRSISCDQGIAGDGAFSLGMVTELEGPLAREGASAYRRLHWETGLVGQALYLQAEAAGLRGTGIGCFFDDEMHGVLGIRTRAFHTLYHFAVGYPVDDTRLTTLPAYPAES